MLPNPAGERYRIVEIESAPALAVIVLVDDAANIQPKLQVDGRNLQNGVYLHNLRAVVVAVLDQLPTEATSPALDLRLIRQDAGEIVTGRQFFYLSGKSADP